MPNRHRAIAAVIITVVTVSAQALEGMHTPAPAWFESHESGFLARAPGYLLAVDKGGTTVTTAGGAEVRLKFPGRPGCAAVAPRGNRKAVVNYLIGNAPERWQTGLLRHGRIACAELYAGIDLVYGASADAIQFEFILAGGVSPETILMTIEGTEGRLTAEGDLEVGGVILRRPAIQREVGAKQVVMEGRYALDADGTVTVKAEDHRPAEPLATDPVLLRHSTYLGGMAADSAFGVAVDRDRNIYITGITASADFPVAYGLQPVLRGVTDLFVTKLSPDFEIVYSTYLGGTDSEIGGPFAGDGWNDIAVDEEQNVYLLASTRSRDFPTTTGVVQPHFGGGPDDVVIAKLSADGSRLIYSTYLGGTGEDQGRAIAVDRQGSAYVTGRTMSRDFPLSRAFQTSHGGNVDAFITRISPDGSTLVYSSFLGGSDIEVGRDIAIDPSGSAYVAGRTVSANFPATSAAFQKRLGGVGAFGQGDAFVARVTADGSLAYATYLGGARGEIAAGIDVDVYGHAYVSGITESTDFPTTQESVQPIYAGGSADGFLTKLDPTGERLVYSTYLGGSDADEEIFGVSVDSRNQAWVAGVTFSNTFPTIDPLQPSKGGLNDAFVAKFDQTGSRLLFSSYLGGTDRENGFRVAVDDEATAYVVGSTRSTRYPTTGDALQPAIGGESDGFLTVVTVPEPPIPPRRRSVRR
jgi:hypothetical protein